MQQVSSAQFNYRDFPPDDRLPAFRHMTAALYDTWALGAASDFRAEAIGHQVGDLVFNEVAFSPARFQRRAAHTSGRDRDFLTLQAQLAGEELLTMDHGIVRLLPGHIYLRDWAYPFDSKATEMHMHTIVIPRHRLAASATLSRQSPVLEWPMDDPGAGMLLKLWLELLGSFSSVSLGKAELLCGAFLGFLDGLMSGLDSDERPATLRAMEQFLAARLRGNVGTEDLCRQFHVSRSTVFRLFKPHGGVKAYLSRMRLERVYADLRLADPARVGVAEIAASWRFNEPSSFSRKFRQQFGLRPSEVLGRDLGQDVPAVAAMIRGVEAFSSYTDWLSRASNPVS
ncbi:MAG: helix-turn-helix transcriptional regulator [Xanthomonadales bacterium]|jgi:AraC-like DNA-binding protein|nr:helix-turn-helix transcriptional regulator [Xanthomonadales bacterium]